MRLNDLRPAPGARPEGKRVGRGEGSGLGKTGGRGHKGQKSRSGGFHKVGFEGGQMPLQRRVPKYGFKSRSGRSVAEVRLAELNRLEDEVVTLEALKRAGIVRKNITRAKVFVSGELKRKVTLQGVGCTAGARSAIESAGGAVREDEGSGGK